MFGLLFGCLSSMVQTGFIIGAGLLVDTFVVRTVTVPATAALMGHANWWPSRPNRPRRAGVRAVAPLRTIHERSGGRHRKDRAAAPA